MMERENCTYRNPSAIVTWSMCALCIAPHDMIRHDTTRLTEKKWHPIHCSNSWNWFKRTQTGTLHRIDAPYKCSHVHIAQNTQRKWMCTILSVNALLTIFYYFYFCPAAAEGIYSSLFAFCFFPKGTHIILGVAAHPAGQRNRMSCAISTIHTRRPFRVHASATTKDDVVTESNELNREQRKVDVEKLLSIY